MLLRLRTSAVQPVAKILTDLVNSYWVSIEQNLRNWFSLR